MPMEDLPIKLYSKPSKCERERVGKCSLTKKFELLSHILCLKVTSIPRRLGIFLC